MFAVRCKPNQLRVAKGVVHRIETGSALLCKQRPIPVAQAVEEIAKIVNEMLRTAFAGRPIPRGLAVYYQSRKETAASASL